MGPAPVKRGLLLFTKMVLGFQCSNAARGVALPQLAPEHLCTEKEKFISPAGP